MRQELWQGNVGLLAFVLFAIFGNEVYHSLKMFLNGAKSLSPLLESTSSKIAMNRMEFCGK